MREASCWSSAARWRTARKLWWMACICSATVPVALENVDVLADGRIVRRERSPGRSLLPEGLLSDQYLRWPEGGVQLQGAVQVGTGGGERRPIFADVRDYLVRSATILTAEVLPHRRAVLSSSGDILLAESPSPLGSMPSFVVQAPAAPAPPAAPAAATPAAPASATVTTTGAAVPGPGAAAAPSTGASGVNAPGAAAAPGAAVAVVPGAAPAAPGVASGAVPRAPGAAAGGGPAAAQLVPGAAGAVVAVPAAGSTGAVVGTVATAGNSTSVWDDILPKERHYIGIVVFALGALVFVCFCIANQRQEVTVPGRSSGQSSPTAGRSYRQQRTGLTAVSDGLDGGGGPGGEFISPESPSGIPQTPSTPLSPGGSGTYSARRQQARTKPANQQEGNEF